MPGWCTIRLVDVGGTETEPQISMKEFGGEGRREKICKKNLSENECYWAFIYCHWTSNGATDVQSRSLRNAGPGWARKPNLDTSKSTFTRKKGSENEYHNTA